MVQAAKQFSGMFQQGRDRIGLVSFAEAAQVVQSPVDYFPDGAWLHELRRQRQRIARRYLVHWWNQYLNWSIAGMERTVQDSVARGLERPGGVYRRSSDGGVVQLSGAGYCRSDRHRAKCRLEQ